MERARSGDIRLANRGTHAKVLIALDDVAIATPDGHAAVPHRHAEDLPAGPHRRDRRQRRRQVAVRAAAAPRDRGRRGAGITVSPIVVVGYVDQLMSQLPAAKRRMVSSPAQFRLGDQRSRQPAGRCRLRLRHAAPADRACCSPGQKARLGLLALRLTEPNFYLMDEPTNHVDIAGQERLEAEILAHEATCVLVSHDRFFVHAIGTRLLRIEGGRIAEVDLPAI